MDRMNRRELLKLGAAGVGALVAPAGLRRMGLGGGSGASRAEVIGGTIVGSWSDSSPRVKLFSVDLPIPRALAPTRTDEATKTDYYELTMRQARQEILPGYTSTIWGYDGTYPGPTIMERQGRSTVVKLTNQLPEAMSCHLHGSPTLPQYDGHPEILVPPGGSYTYYYPNSASARTLWYHDHAIHHTARHVYQGLAGFYCQGDDYDSSLPLPKGEFDVPLLIADKLFARDGSLVFDDDGHDEFLGDVTTVNGKAWPRMAVAARKYRLRFLLGAPSRAYHLKFSNGMPFKMIATDGGLMARPIDVTSFTIGMAERYEAVVDFSKVPVGSTVTLLNTRGDGNMRYVMRFDVVRTASDDSTVPSVLNEIPPLSPSMAVARRRFRFERKHGQWTINGKTWDSSRVDAKPKLGDIEIWELENSSGGWSHPVHIHLIDFQILSRNGRAPRAYERGWKDVAYVGENEIVRVIMRFGPHRGRYVMHCHNLVHEDSDMMNQWEVV